MEVLPNLAYNEMKKYPVLHHSKGMSYKQKFKTIDLWKKTQTFGRKYIHC